MILAKGGNGEGKKKKGSTQQSGNVVNPDIDCCNCGEKGHTSSEWQDTIGGDAQCQTEPGRLTRLGCKGFHDKNQCRKAGQQRHGGTLAWI